MQEVLIGLQFAALIPIIIIFVYKPQLNLFFKLLFASILLSVLFDLIGTVIGFFILKNNLLIYCLYFLCNTLLITYMWQSIPFYRSNEKKAVKITGGIILALMLISLISFGISHETFIAFSVLNVFIGVVFPLYYYYKKLELATYSYPLSDPYFYAASGYILFSLSTIIILTGQLKFAQESFMIYVWGFRQLLYLIYNLIIGYAFYILHISQIKHQ